MRTKEEVLEDIRNLNLDLLKLEESETVQAYKQAIMNGKKLSRELEDIQAEAGDSFLAKKNWFLF